MTENCSSRFMLNIIVQSKPLYKWISHPIENLKDTPKMIDSHRQCVQCTCQLVYTPAYKWPVLWNRNAATSARISPVRIMTKGLNN